MTTPLTTTAAGLRVDGADLGDAAAARVSDAVVALSALGGFWDGVPLTPGSATAVGALGALPTATLGAAGARTATATLAVGASTPARLAAALQALAALVPVGPQLAVALDLVPDRVWRVQRTGWSVTLPAPEALATWATVTLTLQAVPPAAESVARRVIVVASADAGPTAVPIGTLPSWPRVLVMPGSTGACTNPTLTVTDLAGRTVATIALTGAISGSEWVEIDMARCGIWTHLAADSYAAVFAGDWRTGGDYVALDPDDGDRALGVGPGVRLTVASGSARAQLDYPLFWDA